MTQGERLTKQELSWLLTQEARSAAKTLRKGVVALSQYPQPLPEAQASPAELVSSLNTLDDAMKMLASLNAQMGPRGVRGRVDLASLVCEVAPQAKVHIAPGSGTEVFGDESELRRMMQVLLAQSAGGAVGQMAEAPELWITRERDEVRVAVALGPEIQGSVTSERAWLNRMALRYGGRLELGGGQESLVLSAEGAHERDEVEALRKELQEAQRQGEAYARELAAVLANQKDMERASLVFSVVPPPTGTLAPMITLASALASQLRPLLSSPVRESDPPPSRPFDPQVEPSASSMTQLHEVLADLGQLGKLRQDELPEPLELVALVKEVLAELEPRANRHGTELILDAPTALDGLLQPSSVRVLVRMLACHAIEATPRSGHVQIRVRQEHQFLVLTVDDEGPSVPAGARAALVWKHLDPASLGRPRGIHLLCASAIASWLNGSLDLDDTPFGGTRTQAFLPLR